MLVSPLLYLTINMLHYQVHYHLKDLMTELQQTNLEKTLLAWCRQNSQVMPRYCKNVTQIHIIIINIISMCYNIYILFI